MSKNKISIFFVLDETGSMAGCIQQTISGFNEYLNTLKEDKKSKYKLSLLKFNSGGLTQVCDDMPLKRVPELSLDNYRPANMTPLYDAIGHGINLMNSKRKVLFVIMTDGEENCSKEYDRSDIFKLVANQKKAGWQFAFLGADQDAWIAGGKIGIVKLNTMSYNREQTKDTFSIMAAASVSYAAKGGVAADDLLSSDTDTREKQNENK